MCSRRMADYSRYSVRRKKSLEKDKNGDSRSNYQSGVKRSPNDSSEVQKKQSKTDKEKDFCGKIQ